MLASARLASNGDWHVGKGCKNHDVSAQPGRNRLTRSRATSEDSRHEAAFYSAMPGRSRAKHGPAHVEHVKSSSGRFAYSFRLDVKTEGVQSSQVGHGTTASAEQVAVDDRVVVADLGPGKDHDLYDSLGRTDSRLVGDDHDFPKRSKALWHGFR